MKKNTALLIIDLQKGFRPSPKLVDGILKRATNYPTIVATQFVNGNNLYRSVLRYRKRTKQEIHLVQIPEKTKVFKKKGYGLPPGLVAYLKRKNITQVDVAGLETDACVLAAMFSLWDAGIRPRLLEALTSTPDAKLKKAARVIVERNFGSLNTRHPMSGI